MLNKICYFSWYDLIKDNRTTRQVPLAGIAKSDYIIYSYNAIDYFVEVISPSLPQKNGLSKSENIKINEKSSLKLFFSFNAKNRAMRLVRKCLLSIQLLFFILFRIKKENFTVIYHSLYFIPIVKLLKKLKKTKLIYEINEIYSDVSKNKKTKARELKAFDLADAFIFSNNYLNQIINTEDKPYVINHGNYKMLSVNKLSNGKENENHIINCVYSGTFDINKGGALKAIEIAEFLTDKYCINILGFGTEQETKKVIEKIKEVSDKSKSKIIYHGLKKGKEFEDFLQTCDIGLSTQHMHNELNNTSFPSKVLNYLANGLSVVSARLDILETSVLNNLITYYNEDTPEAIAEAIMSIKTKENFNPSGLLHKIDLQFHKDLKKMMENINDPKD